MIGPKPVKVPVASLQPEDRIHVVGRGWVIVKRVEAGQHKDALTVRLRGTEPLHVAWNAEIVKDDR